MAPLSVCAVVLPAPTKKLGGLSEVAKRQLAEELAHKDVVIFAMIESSLVSGERCCWTPTTPLCPTAPRLVRPLWRATLPASLF